MKLFSGTNNIEFSKRVSFYLNEPLSKIRINRFKDGEIKIIIEILAPEVRPSG